ncbi:unnamed protein product [Caenorhabditis auriculariae]|uniref:Uncharacterized protein n=1 Tax=Caenorhabditis auriculariae TaxID=2777116 RepID=A0A8S1GPR3_9PELO|nr:unnamed protein product [Caenorhabditis auriculariae]
MLRSVILVALSASPMLACIGGGGGNCCPPSAPAGCGGPPCSSSSYAAAPAPLPVAAGGAYPTAPAGFAGPAPLAPGGPIAGGSYAAAGPIGGGGAYASPAIGGLGGAAGGYQTPIGGGFQQQQGGYQAGPGAAIGAAVNGGGFQQQQGSYQAQPQAQVGGFQQQQGGYQAGPAAAIGGESQQQGSYQAQPQAQVGGFEVSQNGGYQAGPAAVGGQQQQASQGAQQETYQAPAQSQVAHEPASEYEAPETASVAPEAHHEESSVNKEAVQLRGRIGIFGASQGSSQGVFLFFFVFFRVFRLPEAALITQMTQTAIVISPSLTDDLNESVKSMGIEDLAKQSQATGPPKKKGYDDVVLSDLTDDEDPRKVGEGKSKLDKKSLKQKPKEKSSTVNLLDVATGKKPTSVPHTRSDKVIATSTTPKEKDGGATPVGNRKPSPTSAAPLPGSFSTVAAGGFGSGASVTGVGAVSLSAEQDKKFAIQSSKAEPERRRKGGCCIIL